MTREEAIQNIKKAIGFSDVLDESIFTLFPEMKESEDESIRKFICSIIDNLEPKDFVGVKKMNVIAWLEKQSEKKPEVKHIGWVARDSEHNPYLGLGLVLFKAKPKRSGDCWTGVIDSQLPWESFPDLKWEDEPVEVEVEVTIRKKITLSYDKTRTEKRD